MATTNSCTRRPGRVVPVEVDDVVEMLADLHAVLRPQPVLARPALHLVQGGAA